MSYQMIFESKRIAADTPDVLSTFGELRAKEGDVNLTKIIYVTGDGDYGAMYFDRSDITPEEAYRAAHANSGEFQYEIDDEEVYIRTYDFGEVDPEFIAFIKDTIVDYDQAKAADFYIVKEDA